MEKDLEYIRISRSNANRFAPKGGYKLVQEEKTRKASLEGMQSAQNLRFDPSTALLSAIQSKASVDGKLHEKSSPNLSPSNASSGIKFQPTIMDSSLKGSKPRTVREWAEKNISVAQDQPIASSMIGETEEIQSSLMKKA